MIIHNLTQGSPEWLAYRAKMRNASDAPAMMGCSAYKTRAELLREVHTGVTPEVDAGTQKRFDNGHRVEALARPLAEEFIGAELYPVTGSLGSLSASFDGLTMDESTGFEHKALNDELRAAFADMETIAPEHRERSGCRSLPLMYRVQMEQQLLVSGAERVLFMASAWTADEELIEERHCWYYPDAKLRQQIVDGWAQFERDLAAYVPPAAAEPAPVGRAPDTLPALRIELTGQVTASNLAEFKATALGAIRSVNRALKTDQDFADARKSIKWCEDIETRLDAAKEHALSQTADIDALFKALDDIKAEARRVRLDLDKVVTKRSVEVKEEAVAAARAALDLHIAAVNAEIAPMRLQSVAADFAGAIKGKRSIDSMQDALDTLLALSKINADAQGRAIRANVTAFNALALGDDLGFLFRDLDQLVHKAADDFAAVVRSRIAQHREAEAAKEAKRKAEEAERIAAAERRAAAEAEARVRAEQEAQARREREAAEADRQRLLAERQKEFTEGRGSQQVLKAEGASPDATDRDVPATTSPGVGPMGAGQAADAAPAGGNVSRLQPAASEPATLTLGMICERLQFTVRADFLVDVLHIAPAKVEGKRPGTYTESQFQVICSQLQSHISAMGELYAQQKAA